MTTFSMENSEAIRTIQADRVRQAAALLGESALEMVQPLSEELLPTFRQITRLVLSAMAYTEERPAEERHYKGRTSNQAMYDMVNIALGVAHRTAQQAEGEFPVVDAKTFQKWLRIAGNEATGLESVREKSPRKLELLKRYDARLQAHGKARLNQAS